MKSFASKGLVATSALSSVSTLREPQSQYLLIQSNLINQDKPTVLALRGISPFSGTIKQNHYLTLLTIYLKLVNSFDNVLKESKLSTSIGRTKSSPCFQFQVLLPSTQPFYHKSQLQTSYTIAQGIIHSHDSPKQLGILTD